MNKSITRRAFVAAAATGTAAIAAGCSKPQEETAAPAAETAESQAPATTSDAASSPAETASAASAGGVARPSTNGRLTVQNARLVDASGNNVQLKGFSTHGIAWFGQYVNAECFAELSGWGANVARLAMYTHENDGYCSGGDQAALRDLLVRGVKYAAGADMYCIVDWHVLQDLDPNVYIDQAKEFWAWASSEFADATNVIYEICNEPNGSTTWADVKSYAEVILPIIRANDASAVVLVGTPNWSQHPDQAAADPLADEHAMYTLHFYAATHRDDLRATLRSTVEGGAPVFVSEYGICDASGNGGLDLESAAAWVNLMDELGVSCCCWSLCNKAESASFIASSCEKTSGFEDGDLTSSGAWLKAMLSGETPTEVARPDGSGTGVGTFTLESITGNDGLDVSANLRQRWETNGTPYLLYDITVTSGTTPSNWGCDLVFSANVAISESWNCTIAADGATVHITGVGTSGVGLIVYPA